MRLDPSLAALGVSSETAARVFREGHVVGRGEGFVSHEWREHAAGPSLLLCGHAAADGTPEVVQPFVAGLGWESADVIALRPSAQDPHEVGVSLVFGDSTLTASAPDAAARRKLFPVGFAAQVSVVVLPVVADDSGGVPMLDIAGEATDARTFELLGAPWTAYRVPMGTAAVWWLQPGSPRNGDRRVSGAGKAWVRVGASTRRREGTSGPAAGRT